jgi:hypothetical protein
MQVMVGIDGAFSLGLGDSSGGYVGRYRGSFVNRLCEAATGRSTYIQGPAVGIENDIRAVAESALRWLESNTARGDTIAFVGYSRGAAACLCAAHMMARSTLDGRFLVALGLFDAVANDPLHSGDWVRYTRGLPSTAVYHARRLDDPGNSLFPRLDIRTDIATQRDFPGDHGDLGGHLRGDIADYSRDAYLWIRGRLAALGFVSAM